MAHVKIRQRQQYCAQHYNQIHTIGYSSDINRYGNHFTIWKFQHFIIKYSLENNFLSDSYGCVCVVYWMFIYRSLALTQALNSWTLFICSTKLTSKQTNKQTNIRTEGMVKCFECLLGIDSLKTRLFYLHDSFLLCRSFDVTAWQQWRTPYQPKKQ